ncbi:MAG: HEPN domain-containing protein [bacterium]
MGKRQEANLKRIELAQVMLEDARFNLLHKRYRCAISRSYYACHHAARACLNAVGQPLQKSRSGAHRACINQFSLHLIKTKVLPVSLSATLQELVDRREAADYDLEIKDVETLARRTFQKAETFLNEVIKWQSKTLTH